LSDVDYTVGPWRFILLKSKATGMRQKVNLAKNQTARRNELNRGAIRMTNSNGKNKTDLLEARHYEKPWAI
jgi:hypothetical protein